VDITWNRGKSSPILKMVDRLAKNAAKSPIKSKDTGYHSGKVSRHRTGERGAALLLPAMNQELNIRIYAHTVVGKAECKASFTVLSEGENNFTQKHRAYVATGDRDKIHRHGCYRVRFNDNPHYPVFEIIEVLDTFPP
jgi:hypothetical protein